jgi:hypothetical protein
MKTREKGICEHCEKKLTGMAYEQTHTKEGHDFCSYECMAGYYGDDIPEREDFIIVAD